MRKKAQVFLKTVLVTVSTLGKSPGNRRNLSEIEGVLLLKAFHGYQAISQAWQRLPGRFSGGYWGKPHFLHPGGLPTLTLRQLRQLRKK